MRQEFRLNPVKLINLILEENMKATFSELVAAIRNDLAGRKAVIGISGGKDSSIAAALIALAIGKENVVGISMPNGEGKEDEPFVKALEKWFDREFIKVNIKSTYETMLAQMKGIEILEDTRINLAPRIRMAMLFAYAQSIPGSRVINTCNLSEDMLGYSTLFGDLAGSYAPLKYFTVNEIISVLGETLIKSYGFPRELVYRVPTDGLCGSTDEEKLGLSYYELDSFIRTGKTLGPQDWFLERDYGCSNLDRRIDFLAKVRSKYEANKFKLRIVNIPGPSIDPAQGKNFLVYPKNGETE